MKHEYGKLEFKALSTHGVDVLHLLPEVSDEDPKGYKTFSLGHVGPPDLLKEECLHQSVRHTLSNEYFKTIQGIEDVDIFTGRLIIHWKELPTITYTEATAEDPSKTIIHFRFKVEVL